MLRLLIDEQGLNWQTAWNCVYHTFTCGFYTIKESQFEKWPVDMLGNLLPRHLELIYLLNSIFMEKVKKFFAKDKDLPQRLKRMSLIEETASKQVRIANLCVVACHKVIFCGELQQELLFKGPLQDFKLMTPHTFEIIPNGVNPRRWIYNSNRQLAKLITEEIGDESEWLTDLDLLKVLVNYKQDFVFFDKLLEVRA
mmetsp:Transcript_43400/g.31698  ORF Transcript_43400/g.31698 Transcript_43400/m.31698 type:complete len:197 (-) Transcript_43400:1075-1665(-)